MILKMLPHPDFMERGRSFFEKYELVNVILPGDERYSKRKMKRKNERICLFCGRMLPETSFSSFSHLMSKGIGNKDLYSDFECSSCNQNFSTIENDLASYLGLSRSITSLKDQTPYGFASKKIMAKARNFNGDDLLIIAPKDVKKAGNTTTITYSKNSYSPAKVYRSFLKFSLSLLPLIEVQQNYQLPLKYLQGKFKIDNGAMIAGYRLNFEINLPLHVYVFKKKVKNDKIPKHVINFLFQNHVIAFPMPLCKEDLHFYNEDYDLFVPPPYFTNEEIIARSFPVAFIRDFSSEDLLCDEEEVISLSIDPHALENCHAYDPETDSLEKREFESIRPKYLILTRPGVIINPKEFSKFVISEMDKAKDKS